MKSRNNSLLWKRAVKIALALILALDAGLLYVNWRSAQAAPQSQLANLQRLKDNVNFLQADVLRAREIHKDLPDLAQDCNQFYQQNLLPAATGYSTVDAELGQMAANAGVTTSDVSYHQDTVKDRGLSEVTISTVVQGDYSGLIRLLSALERSPHFYILDSLTLASEKSGAIKLNLVLRTYFRT